MFNDGIISILKSKNSIMFIASIVFMLGIFAYFNDCALIISALITCCVIYFIFSRKISIKYILICLLMFYIGFFNAYFRTNTSDELEQMAPLDAVVTGQIISIPNKVNGNIKFFLNVNDADGKSIKAKSYVTLNSGEYNIGDYIKLNARVRKPFKASNPSQFDYGKYLQNYNAFTTIYANNANIIDANLDFKWKFLRKLNQTRNNIITHHAKYLQSPNLEILGGVVFGDDAVAPPDYVKTTFVNSGLLHILAASGMNVAFIFCFWFFIMKFFKVPYRINILGGIVMVILYTLMTGLGASVLRAALMLLFVQLGKLIDRDAHSVALLSFVAVLLLLYNPAYINDVGFQLSFVVTFGLLTMAKIIFEKIENIKTPNWIKATILIPIVAQIWVAPIQMFYFNTISTYSILANIITVPFLSVVSFGGFVSSILATITPIADFVCMVFDFVLKYCLDIVVIIANYFAQLPNSILQTTHPHILQLLLYYFILLFITYMFKTGFDKKKWLVLLSSILLLFLSTINIPNHKLEIIAFDVQNADAFLIKTPNNKYFIIDTAKQSYKSKNSTARLVISKYLKDRGIKNIEAMILTHFDLDHVGGAVDLINDLHIKQAYVNSFERENFTVNRIFDEIEKYKIPTKSPKNNEIIYSDNDIKLTTFLSGIDNDNENSIITLLQYNDFDMIFMGDAGVFAFDKIQKYLPSNNIEILKVGHHGGKNTVSSEMLNKMGTKVSIISTGPNSFGHPNKNTIKLLNNTKIYRTDENNSIKISSDGYKYSVYTFDVFDKKYIKNIDLNSTK